MPQHVKFSASDTMHHSAVEDTVSRESHPKVEPSVEDLSGLSAIAMRSLIGMQSIKLPREESGPPKTLLSAHVDGKISHDRAEVRSEPYEKYPSKPDVELADLVTRRYCLKTARLWPVAPNKMHHGCLFQDIFRPN